MGVLKDKFRDKAEIVSAEMRDILKKYGNDKIGEVTLSQVYQGMRGITGLVTETSLLDAQDGIRFRGYSIFNKNCPRPLVDRNPCRKAYFI